MDKYRKLLDEMLGKYIEMTWEDKLSEKIQRVQRDDADQGVTQRPGPRSKGSGPKLGDSLPASRNAKSNKTKRKPGRPRANR